MQFFFLIKGMKDMQKEWNADHENKHIAVLLSSLSDLLSKMRPLESMLDSYEFMADTHANAIFDHVWREKMNELVDAGSLSVSDVQSKLWKPTITKCTELVSTLQKRTMTLSVVDQYFRAFFNNKDAAIVHIVNLFRGLRHCVSSFGEAGREERRIREAVDVVQQYWSLCTYSDAAKICVQLKQKLKLTGNFDIVNVLASQVINSAVYFITEYLKS